MIITVTLNPTIDRLLFLETLRENAVNRVSSVKVIPGGKGVNVSKVIKLLGSPVLATGFIAGENGRSLEKSVKDLGVMTDFYSVQGETRVNIKIYDRAKGFTTDLNELGPCIGPEDFESFAGHLGNLAARCDVMVFSGSLPLGAPVDAYRKLVEIAKDKGCTTILDASGDCLKEGLKAGPYMIKPNIHELGEIFGREPSTKTELLEYSGRLLDMGTKTVLVSLGANGMLLMEKEGALFAGCIPVEVKGTVGAGDSLVGSFAYAYEKGLTSGEALKIAAACSTACVCSGSTSDMTGAMIAGYMDNVVIEKYG